MNKRKIQGFINRLEDNIKVYKQNIITMKNDCFKNEKKQEIIFTEGQINEATNIIESLKMLKESIND